MLYWYLCQPFLIYFFMGWKIVTWTGLKSTMVKYWWVKEAAAVKLVSSDSPKHDRMKKKLGLVIRFLFYAIFVPCFDSHTHNTIPTIQNNSALLQCWNFLHAFADCSIAKIREKIVHVSISFCKLLQHCYLFYAKHY